MKRFLLLLFIVLASQLHGFAQKVDELVSSYTGVNANGYFQPLADVLTSTFHTGTAYKTSIDKGFHLYLGVITTTAYITDDKLRFFTGVTDKNFSPQTTAQASTILGPRQLVSVNGLNGTSYTFPAGLGLRNVPLIVPHLTIGNVKGTELDIRFIAIDAGGDFGTIQLAGAGLRHDIGQYFLKKSNLTVSAEYFYQQFKGGNYATLTMHKAGIYAGQQWKLFNYYGYVGYQNGGLNIHYDNPDDGSKVNIDITNKNPLLLGVGMGVKLWVLRINLNASFITPMVAGASLGLNF